MTRRPWHHSNSLDAAPDPKVQDAIRGGRGREFLSLLAAPEATLTRRETENETEAIARFERDGGWWIETREELFARRIAALLTEEPEEEDPFSGREKEALAHYLFGDRLAVAGELLMARDFEGVLWELLTEHPPWSKIAGWMRPTRTGRAPDKGDVQRYIRTAARRFETTNKRSSSDGGRKRVFKALVDERNRESLVQYSLRDMDPMVRYVLQVEQASKMSTVDLAKALNRARGLRRTISPEEVENFMKDPFAALRRYASQPILDLILASRSSLPQGLIEVLDDDLNGYSPKEAAPLAGAAPAGERISRGDPPPVAFETLEESLAKHLANVVNGRNRRS